jgi:glycosyltransferase involved in cell wall biosynthesis
MRSQPEAHTNLRPRVVHVVTSDRAVALMRGQLQFLQQHGFDVTLICSPGEWLDALGRSQNVQVIELPLARAISPVRDLASLWSLWRVMRKLHPAITNVGTPKAGLLGGCAAWLARVPCRVYTLRGLRFETSKGLRRQLLVLAERTACHFAHRIICVSRSLRKKVIADRLACLERTVVFGSGSSNGVDASRFAPTLERTQRAAQLRSELGIPAQAAILGFVGRLTRDKGIPELVQAFLQLCGRFPDLRLLLVGSSEEQDLLDHETLRCLETHPHIIRPGETLDIAPYYALMDVLVLPSHREGFPNVVLEAYASGRPVVAARATGTVDAVRHGETGLLFPIGDVAALVRCLERLLEDKRLAKTFGATAQELVKREFRQEVVWKGLLEEYRGILQTNDLSRSFLPAPRQLASLDQVTHEEDPA